MIIQQQLAVFQGCQAGAGNRVRFAFGGGVPGGEGFFEVRLVAGKLVVESGEEKRVAGAGDEFAQGLWAGGGIGEAFAEDIFRSMQRGENEAQTQQVLGHRAEVREKRGWGKARKRKMR